MLREYIIILSDKQDKILVKRANDAGYDDDMIYLQEHINNWLNDDTIMEKALKEAARLKHCEK